MSEPSFREEAKHLCYFEKNYGHNEACGMCRDLRAALRAAYEKGREAEAEQRKPRHIEVPPFRFEDNDE